MKEIVLQETSIEALNSNTQHTDIFNQILGIDPKSCTVTLYMASVIKNGAIPRFGQVQITTKLGDEFRNVVAQRLRQYRSQFQQQDLLFPEYALDSRPEDYQIEHFDLSAYDNILAQINPLELSADIELFDEKDKRFVAGLRFYVIVLKPTEGEPVYFFRAYTNSKTLMRAFFMALNNDSVYDSMKVFPCQFDEEIDCMCCDGVMFIFDKDHFEKIFRFFETIRKTAKETLEEINTRIPIHNFEAFTKACEGDLRMLRKLKTIASKNYLKSVTMDAIRETIKVHNLSVQIVEVNGREHITYDPSAKDKWELLHLLNDDYLKSLLTGRKYEVTGKYER